MALRTELHRQQPGQPRRGGGAPRDTNPRQDHPTRPREAVGAALQWHREKAGTVEPARRTQEWPGRWSHAEPAVRGQRGVAEAGAPELQHRQRDQGPIFSPDERTACLKRYRLLLVHIAGRINRNNCVMRLRLCASEQTIAHIEAVWLGVLAAYPSFAHEALAACGLAD